jgi:hypothetical protein
MRVRTLLLGACMVVVPLLAMFSHHLPPNFAAKARQALWDPLAARAGWQTAPAPHASPTAPAKPMDAPPVAARAVPEPPPPRAVAAVMPAPAFATADTFDRRGLEGRLVQLGATSISCQPLPGGSGTMASCRLAVDPAGELQRVFQSAGPDAAAALGRLVAEVEAWKQRTASRASAAATARKLLPPPSR